MNDVKLRRHFPETSRITYSTDGITATFQSLAGSHGPNRLTLKNLATGEPEILEFTIVGQFESLASSLKWVWGKLTTDDSYESDLTFDFRNGQLTGIFAAATPKTLPLEKCAERTRGVQYAAQLTTYDIFSPAP